MLDKVSAVKTKTCKPMTIAATNTVSVRVDATLKGPGQSSRVSSVGHYAVDGSRGLGILTQQVSTSVNQNVLLPVAK